MTAAHGAREPGAGAPSFLAGLVLLIVVLAAATALWAMAGRGVLPGRGPLAAEVRVSAFALPRDYGIEAKAVADALTERLQERVESSAAMRFILGEDATERVKETVIPRLLNPDVLARFLEEMPSLGAVFAAEDFRGLATGRLVNRGAGGLEDVAMTLPGALRAEAGEGRPVEVRQPDAGPAILSFGNVPGGATLAFRAWLDGPPADIFAAPGRIRLGAAGPVDGRVAVSGRDAWFGARLEALPWARWLVAGLLASLATLAGIAAIFVLVSGVRVRRASRGR